MFVLTYLFNNFSRHVRWPCSIWTCFNSSVLIITQLIVQISNAQTEV